MLGGDDQQPEGQVRRHLHRAAYPDVPAAVVVVQVGVDALGAAALAIPNRLGRRELAFFAPARVMVDDGDVAQTLGTSTAGVVSLLVGAELEVAFVGFAPGFPYLTGLPDELAALPRRPTPRTSVPESVTARLILRRIASGGSITAM